MAKAPPADVNGISLTYHFSNDGKLTGVSYSGTFDAATEAAIRAEILRAREIAKGR